MALSVAGATAASASTHAAHTVNHVALGDSYASGPGIPTQVDATSARPDQNHPSLLAAARNRQLTDVSCSGATTTALAGAQGTKVPQPDALGADTDMVTLTIGGNDIDFSGDLATCAGLTSKNPTGNSCQSLFTSGLPGPRSRWSVIPACSRTTGSAAPAPPYRSRPVTSPVCGTRHVQAGRRALDRPPAVERAVRRGAYRR
ncbi:GDSL-like Lipase/Acylhydrolase family protein [Streptomyces sp. 3213]|uniref:GDSL-type esterase/lipase family protein n=1 Tax=Streptomyces sp. 3213.3 TaxID=1855348 RepID=UPI00089CA26F|nr:GDSL-type esterase/lipase family protein [Streptomyces sp. 3213.3]SEC93444.1 GDSL-like Lipase/Acylhydrolase family protein [Streptomyces sp. 3213] [Streptomyces sp. 3213.3]